MKHDPEMIEKVARAIDPTAWDESRCKKPEHFERARDRRARATIKAQAALDAAFQWRDIETAPRDGRFLVFGNGNELDGMSLSSADWVKLYKDAEGFTYTHWLPLPTPPEED